MPKSKLNIQSCRYSTSIIRKLKVNGYYPSSVQSSRETSKAVTIPMHVTYDNLQKHRNKEFTKGPSRRNHHPTKPLNKPYENSNSHFPPYNINISNHINHQHPPVNQRRVRLDPKALDVNEALNLPTTEHAPPTTVSRLREVGSLNVIEAAVNQVDKGTISVQAPTKIPQTRM